MNPAPPSEQVAEVLRGVLGGLEVVTLHESPYATVICGDARDLLPTLGRESVDCVVTDPPYGAAWQSNTRKGTFAATTATAAATATATATATYWGNPKELLRFLTGALDVFDEITGRTAEPLVEQQWRALAAVVSA